MAGEVGAHKGDNQLPHCFGSRPWLFQMNGGQKQTCTFFDPINNSLEERILPDFLHGKACLGSYEEWVLLVDELTRECFFFNIISFSKITPPPFPEDTDFFRTSVSISSPPSTSNWIVVVVCISKTFLWVCSPGRKKWKKVPLKYFCRNEGSLWGSSIIHNEQLFVAGGVGETLVLDVALLTRGYVKMTVIDRLRPCPIVLSWYTYMVNCAGDLFSVLIHTYGSGQMITRFEVRRLELFGDEMQWRRVQNIGDYAFFLAGRYGRSLPANEAWGVQRNCIYVLVNNSDGVRFCKFCLDDQVLTFNFLPDSNVTLNGLQWALPTKMLVSILLNAL